MAAEFGYLLNAMERAALESNPAKHNYHDKRIAVLGHVSAIEAERDRLRAENAKLQQEIAKGIHTCGPTCRKTARCAEMADLRAELAECRAALAKVGPYYIPATSVSDEEASELGDGNVSEGIRRALAPTITV